LVKAAARFGKNIKVVNDNGSGNMKDAENYPASLNIPQYWTAPQVAQGETFCGKAYRDAAKRMLRLQLRAIKRE
jgi:hypothetical protein